MIIFMYKWLKKTAKNGRMISALTCTDGWAFAAAATRCHADPPGSQYSAIVMRSGDGLMFSSLLGLAAIAETALLLLAVIFASRAAMSTAALSTDPSPGSLREYSVGAAS
jgi:hypothetical protein|eukprot:COSAG06_NODE_2534_length_6710_cov_23.487521_11_plen_110_part_00